MTTENTQESKRINLSTAQNSLMIIRINSNELDTSITNVNRSNPMLARALRDKLNTMRAEFDVLEAFIVQQGGISNEQEQQEKQSSSEETPSGKETSTASSNTPKSDNDKDSGVDGSNGGESTATPKPDDGNGESRPMTAAEKIAARKAEQNGEQS